MAAATEILRTVLGPLHIGRDFEFGYALTEVSPDRKSELTMAKDGKSFRVWLRPASDKAPCYKQTARFCIGYDGKPPDRDGPRVVERVVAAALRSEAAIPQEIYEAYVNSPADRAKLVPWGDKLELRVTIGCNESCGFCNSDTTVMNHCKSEAAVVDAISRTSELGVKEIVFTGGEPTLMPGLPGWVRDARRRGLIVWLQTNGTMRDPESYWEQFRAPDGELLLPHHIVMSLHTRFADRLPLITGLGGTFERKVATMRSAVALGMECRLSHVISIHNMDETPEFPDWVADTFGNAVKIQFSFVAPTGHGASHPELMPRVRDVAPRLARALDAAERRGVPAVVTDVCGIPVCALPSHRRFFSNAIRPNELVTMGRERTKFDFCSTCVFDRSCTGFWRTYVDRYGSHEFAPILPAPVGRLARIWQRLRRPAEQPSAG
ncbi:MAG TPA: radical SAM protein [Candidatus Dormibacteraeota bacterium]|nr:radical SAM protein [Candidatus Dormibacteraeota bacterium]